MATQNNHSLQVQSEGFKSLSQVPSKRIVNNTSLDTATPLTKNIVGREIWSSMRLTYSELTVKLTSVIMVLGKCCGTSQLLNNVVCGTGY